MAAVYLAEDLKHDRKVAIKVLKPELAAAIAVLAVAVAAWGLLRPGAGMPLSVRSSSRSSRPIRR